MYARGWITTGHWPDGAPLRIHIATPLGLFLLTGLSLRLSAWAATLAAVLIHELGHAALVRRFRLRVTAVDVHALGGACHYEGYATPVQAALIAWGGVAAQVVSLAIAEVVAKTVGIPESALPAMVAFEITNVAMIAVNLVPVKPLDGATAWTLFRWSNLRQLLPRRKPAHRAKLEKELARIESELARSKAETEPEDDDDDPPTYLN